MTAKRTISSPAAPLILCVVLLVGALTARTASAQTAGIAEIRAASENRDSPAPVQQPEVCPIEDHSAFAGTEPSAGRYMLSAPYATRAASSQARTFHRRGLSIQPRLQPRSSAEATAPASVFMVDPDDPAPSDIDLQNLTGEGTRLDGQYARVRSAKLDPGQPSATGKDGLADYRFTPILGEGAGVQCTSAAPEEVGQYCSPFDAVNVYYHVDRFAREYWQDRLGLDIDFQADITVHMAGDGAVANADANSVRLRAGDIFKKNAALEDEIIYHEYTHLVTAQLGFDIDIESSMEARGLSEGYADYFAASYTNDPRIGEWIVVCPDRQSCTDDQGREDDDELTRLDLDPEVWNWSRKDDSTLQYGFCLRYHEGDGKCKASYGYRPGPYVWGMIWSNTLWDIRTRLGAVEADPIFVEAIRMHQSGEDDDVDFTEAVAHVIFANRVLNGGQNEALILESFETRGFMIPIIDSAEERESDDALPRASSIEVYPNPATTTAWIQVEPSVLHDIELRIVDLLGRTVAVPEPMRPGAGSNLMSVDVSRLAPGVYLVEASSSTERASKRLTVVR